MTFETIAIAPELISIPVVIHQPAVGQKLRMTAYAVLTDYFPTGLPNVYNLRFKSQGKHRSMSQPVLRLEVILADDIAVGNMTVVAVCPFAV
jgi:hypothetical protein